MARLTPEEKARQIQENIERKVDSYLLSQFFLRSQQYGPDIQLPMLVELKSRRGKKGSLNKFGGKETGRDANFANYVGNEPSVRRLAQLKSVVKISTGRRTVH